MLLFLGIEGLDEVLGGPIENYSQMSVLIIILINKHLEKANLPKTLEKVPAVSPDLIIVG